MLKPIDLCPESLPDSLACNSRFCQYRNKKGNCSLDISIMPKEYEVEDIADIVQVSRQRIWRIVDTAMAKLRNTAGKREDI
jgi:hypothetical protein